MSGPLIAVVEDQFILALDMVSTLERAGFRTRFAGSARLALKQASEGEYPRGLVADIDLGRGDDGITLAQKLRTLKALPLAIVFSTATDDAATRARAALCQPVAFLPKPGHPALIVAALRRAFESEGEA